MDIKLWQGDITLSADHKLKDIRLHTASNSDDGLSKLSFPSSLRFRLLSFVNRSRIPLHLIAGKGLEVFTEEEETETWIGDNLVKGPRISYSEDGTEQYSDGWEELDLALLLAVDGDVKAYRGGPRITELLVFASVSRTAAAEPDGLLTPPRSSSPNLQDAHRFTSTQNAKVYAIPLSSDLCYNPSFFTEPPTPPPEETSHDSTAKFFPAVDFSTISRSNPRKRQRLDSLFEDATQKNKRSRRKGGENISKIMATPDQSNLSKPEPPRAPEMLVRKRPKAPQSGPGLGLGLSRSQSLGSLRDFEEARPLSRGSGGGVLARTKRSSLNRVASSSSPAPESGIEAQNKNALSRVVMAGMRMYGLQQRKRTSTLSRAASEAPTILGGNSVTAIPVSTQQDGDEDEYKLIYHQTFKSSAFFFRRQMGTMALGQDMLRDNVDKFLALFCSDPMQQPELGSSQLLGDDALGTGNGVFDTPSNGAVITDITPIRKSESKGR